MHSEFKKIVLAEIGDFVKPEGFRKRDAYYSRKVHDVIHLLHVQSSQSTTAERLKITVNVGIFSVALEAALRGPITKPTQADSHWLMRLGHLAPANRDLWWEVDDVSEAHRVGREVGEMIRDFALPAFASIDSTKALQQLWESGSSPGLTEYTRNRYLNVLRASPAGATDAH